MRSSIHDFSYSQFYFDNRLTAIETEKGTFFGEGRENLTLKSENDAATYSPLFMITAHGFLTYDATNEVEKNVVSFSIKLKNETNKKQSQSQITNSRHEFYDIFLRFIHPLCFQLFSKNKRKYHLMVVLSIYFMCHKQSIIN